MIAIRGATTIDFDIESQVKTRAVELVKEIFTENNLNKKNIVSIVFSQTKDIISYYPATAVRLAGYDYPLFSTQEPDVKNSLPLCIRVMILVDLDIDKSHVKHIYLHGSTNLRQGNKIIK